MNKYTARGLNEQAAIHGRKVLVVTGTQRTAADAFDDFEATLFPSHTRVVRAHGRQRIEYISSGSVAFVTANSQGHRGVAADVIFIDWDALGPRESVLVADLTPCLRPGGEIVRA